MFLIPFDQKVNWRKPPIITLLLVAANAFIFFVLQSGGDDTRAEAYRYYLQSSLPSVEFPAYQRYLKKNNPGEPFADEPLIRLLQVEFDADFQTALQEGEIITSSHKKYAIWVRQRGYFESLLGADFTAKYSLKTAQPSFITLLSHMFLHADLWHLLGNMLFLIAVGFLVEATLGKSAYLLCYLLGGLGSVLFEMLLTEPDMVLSLGASGAISGLMGMYAVLYWTRRIRFFFFLVVYFDYISLPAIILLPIWMGKEIFSMVVYADSNTSFMAHLGGLISGALLGVVAKFLIRSHDMSFYDKAKEKEDLQKRLEVASGYCKKMEYKKALPLLRKLYRENEAHPEILYRLQQCARLTPASDTFHQRSQKLFALADSSDPKVMQWVRECFQHYIKNAQPTPKLSGRVIHHLFDHFLRAGDIENAELLAKGLLKRGKNNAESVDLLERFIILLQKKGQQQKSLFFKKKLAQLQG